MGKLSGSLSRVMVAGPDPLTLVGGSYELDGTNAPVKVKGKEQGFTVTKSGTTGQTVVTFNRSWKDLVFVLCQVDGSTGTNDAAYNIGASNDPGDIDTSASIIIESQSAAGTAANADGPRINFLVGFINTP